MEANDALARTVEVGDLPARGGAPSGPPRSAGAPGAPAAPGSRGRHVRTSASEEEARFVQERVALYGIVGTVLQSSSLTIFTVAQMFATTQVDFQAARAPHLAGISITLGAWLFCRGPLRPAWVVRIVDALSMLCVVGSFVLMCMQLPRFVRPELVSAIITLIVTTTRATLVPSSALRTVILTSLAWVPTFGVVWLVHHDGPLHDDFGAPQPFLARALTEMTTWSVLGTTLVSVTSQVIYGLRREVREAKKLGQYTLLEKLGEGGMGQVFRARHAMLRRPTAVKLLHPDRREGVESLARFEREVQLTAQLSHPNVVTVFDYGRTPAGVFYYAMELLDGQDLETVVERGGPMLPERAVRVLVQVASALAEAHAVGLIHRDIKPANIILCSRASESDVAKVVDFGLVKDLAEVGDRVRAELSTSSADVDDDAPSSLSRTGAILGTPMYLAPEALLDPASVDGRADLYALGAVGYYLLTGSVVFGGTTVVDVCRHHLHTAPTPPSVRLAKRDPSRTIPAALEAVVLRCLAKDPADRFPDASRLRAALEAVLAGPPATSQPPEPPLVAVPPRPPPVP